MTSASRPGKRSEPDFSILKRVEKEEPDEITFRTDCVLAFDQSLNATGWVVVMCVESRLSIVASGMIAGKTEATGHEGNLTKATQVFLAAQMLLDQWPTLALAHESPPIGGAKMMRPESSLLSANSIRNAAILKNRTFTSVSAQTAKKLVCGKANADKKEAHKALAEKWGNVAGYKEHITNEAKRDAFMVALTYLREV